MSNGPGRLHSAFDRSWSSLTVQLSVVTALTIAAAYICQPLLPFVADEYSLEAGEAGVFASAGQLGYALGILLLLPLSDSIRPRRHLTVQMTVAALALAATAAAPAFWLVCVGAFVVGVASNAAQILLPLATRHAPGTRGAGTVALLGSSVLLGMFGGRIVATELGAVVGWRGVFVIFAVGMVAAVFWVRRLIGPEVQPGGSPIRYVALLSALPVIVVRTPLLRWLGLRQGLFFVGFNSIWTVVALEVLGPPFFWTPAAAGLLGFAGVAGAMVVPFTGRFIAGPVGIRLVLIGAGFVVVAGCLLVGFSRGSPVLLIAGLAIMTLATQISHVTQQTLLFRISGAETGRANTIYLFIVFLGGALGAWCGAIAFGAGGIAAVGFLAAGAALLSTAAAIPVLRITWP